LLQKICYKVSLCENCQRQSRAFIGLTSPSVQKMIGGGRAFKRNFVLSKLYYSARLPCFHELWRMLYLHRNYIYLYSPWWQHRHIKNIHANKKKKCIYIKSLHKKDRTCKVMTKLKRLSMSSTSTLVQN